MLDTLMLWTVWFSAVVVLLAGLSRLNGLPRGGGLVVHLKKFQYLVLLSGAVCIVLSPIYGWGWSVYGGYLTAVAVGLMVATKVVQAYCRHVSLTFDHVFDVLE